MRLRADVPVDTLAVAMSSVLRRVLGSLALRGKDAIACESCGQDFTCGATLTGCWCMKVKLTDKVRSDLRARYRTCLCKSCLEREATRAASDSA
jgi:hypothetical protein